MSNIFTQTTNPPFQKQSVNEYFIAPMFMGEDIRGAVTVRTDIKGTERLNRISRPSMITKPKLLAGFNPSGSFALTYQDITVKPMAIEFEQNAREFWGAIVEQLLASGYKEDDVEQMKAPDIWNKIMLPLIAQAGQSDLIRQMYFADPSAETFSSGIATGTPDPNYNGYTGFLSHFYKALVSGVIPSDQHVAIASGTSARKQEQVETFTYAATTTKVGLTINGVLYEQAYATSATVTMSNWLATHKATIEARSGINGVIVTNPSAGAIKIVSRYKGGKFTAAAVATGGGSFATSGEVTPVSYGALASNEADTTLSGMLDVAPPELNEFDLVFMITSTMWRNLVKTFKNRETLFGDTVMVNGAKLPSYEGIPIMIRPEWDKWIANATPGMFPHRAILTTQKNLLFATDGTNDSEMIETWYNQDAQMRRYRVQYKAQTAYLHKELIVLAGFAD